MAPEVIMLYSLGDLLWRPPSFATSVRGRVRQAEFSVRYELIAYVLYGSVPINVVIIVTIRFTQAACNVVCALGSFALLQFRCISVLEKSLNLPRKAHRPIAADFVVLEFT
jgi:hypothetical protein